MRLHLGELIILEVVDTLLLQFLQFAQNVKLVGVPHVLISWLGQLIGELRVHELEVVFLIKLFLIVVDQGRWQHQVLRHCLFLLLLLSLLLLLVFQIEVSQIGGPFLTENLLQIVLVLLHELLNLIMAESLVTESAVVALVTESCAVQILAGIVFQIVRELAVCASLAGIGQIEFADIFGQIL